MAAGGANVEVPIVVDGTGVLGDAALAKAMHDGRSTLPLGDAAPGADAPEQPAGEASPDAGADSERKDHPGTVASMEVEKDQAPPSQSAPATARNPGEAKELIEQWTWHIASLQGPNGPEACQNAIAYGQEHPGMVCPLIFGPRFRTVSCTHLLLTRPSLPSRSPVFLRAVAQGLLPRSASVAPSPPPCAVVGPPPLARAPARAGAERAGARTLGAHPAQPPLLLIVVVDLAIAGAVVARRLRRPLIEESSI